MVPVRGPADPVAACDAEVVEVDDVVRRGTQGLAWPNAQCGQCSLPQYVGDQLGAHLPGDRVADLAPAEAVQHVREVEKPPVADRDK